MASYSTSETNFRGAEDRLGKRPWQGYVVWTLSCGQWMGHLYLLEASTLMSLEKSRSI